MDTRTKPHTCYDYEEKSCVAKLSLFGPHFQAVVAYASFTLGARNESHSPDPKYTCYLEAQEENMIIKNNSNNNNEQITVQCHKSILKGKGIQLPTFVFSST